MKYIRTKEGYIGEWGEYGSLNIPHKINIQFPYYETYNMYNYDRLNKVLKEELNTEVVKQADTIEELCDEFVVKYKGEEKPRCIDMTELLKECADVSFDFKEHIKWLFHIYKEQIEICNLAIWTDKGLIYVAEMNDEGELELL